MDEPRRHRSYLAAVAITAILTCPLPFIGSTTRYLLGLPLWLWWSFGMTATLSALVAWGVLRLWREDGS